MSHKSSDAPPGPAGADLAARHAGPTTRPENPADMRAGAGTCAGRRQSVKPSKRVGSSASSELAPAHTAARTTSWASAGEYPCGPADRPAAGPGRSGRGRPATAAVAGPARARRPPRCPVDLPDRGPDLLVGNAAPAQLHRHRAPGQPALAVLGECVPVGEGRIVDQPQLGEPVEDTVGGVVRDAALAQRGRQLGPAVGAPVEQPQADDPGDLLDRGLAGIPSSVDRVASLRRSSARSHQAQKSTWAGTTSIGAPSSSCGHRCRASP